MPEETTTKSQAAALKACSLAKAAFYNDLSDSKRNKILKEIAESLDSRRKEIIIANTRDLDRASGMKESLKKRLKMTDSVINGMIESLNQISGMQDPLGTVMEERTLKSGIRLKKVSVPIGVIMIIFESRPNVTIDAAALCIKSGNSAILKGGSEALETNKCLMVIIKEVLQRNDAYDKVQLITDTDREALKDYLKMDSHIDLIIPRGGESLMTFVKENSRIPMLKHDKGICHIYIDDEADIAMAKDICINAKAQNPGTCNAVETIIINNRLGTSNIKSIIDTLKEKGIEVRGCERAARISDISPATEKDWDTEYLDYIVSVKIVDSMQEAIDFINKHSSNHTEAIITGNKAKAEEFMRKIDSSTIFHNASTRFTDGFQFGMGAEIGISTQKLHARGPVGLKELTTYKYICFGNGQIRN